ncbi:hypothetical protein ABE288_26475 [Bacillus salipaludis]|uniref:hypothetical protein n=1 Tax=Bacillus salipaludis TaxID=2547811 RepID=UPI003D2465C9
MVFLANGFYHTEVIDIVTSVTGGAKCRMHFQLTTESMTGGGLTTITYTITNFLDSNCMIFYLTVDEHLFPFDPGIAPGGIGTIKFSRNGASVPAIGNVYMECGGLEFEFGSLCTAVLKGDCGTPTE